MLSPQSLHGCLDPYPAMPLRCIYPFLPKELRPHLRSEKVRRNQTPVVIQLQRRTPFRDCNHSFMFRLPCSLDPLAVPTAEAQSPGRLGRLHHAMNMWLPIMNRGIATCLNRAIGTTGLSPDRLRPFRPLPRSRRAELPHRALQQYSLPHKVKTNTIEVGVWVSRLSSASQSGSVSKLQRTLHS